VAAVDVLVMAMKSPVRRGARAVLGCGSRV